MNDCMNRVRRNAKHLSQDFLTKALGVKFANLSHLIIVQFCLSIFSAVVVFATTLLGHIQIVIRSGSKKQVGRVNARSIVASMEHAKSGCEVGIGELVSENMGPDASTPKSDNAVSEFIDARRPNPTIAGLIGIQIQSFLRRTREVILFRDVRAAIISPTGVVGNTKRASVCGLLAAGN